MTIGDAVINKNSMQRSILVIKKIQKFCAPILTAVRICRYGKKAERTTAFMQVDPGVILLGLAPFPAGTLILYT